MEILDIYRLAVRVAPEGPRSARAWLFSPVLAMEEDARQAGWSPGAFKPHLSGEAVRSRALSLARSCFDMGSSPWSLGMALVGGMGFVS